MNEDNRDPSILDSFKEQRDKLVKQIDALEAQLRICEEAIADLTDVQEGKIPKDRIIELLKVYLRDNPGRSYEEISEYVTNHGGIVQKNLAKRLRTSLTRSTGVGTLVERDGKFYIAE